MTYPILLVINDDCIDLEDTQSNEKFCLGDAEDNLAVNVLDLIDWASKHLQIKKEK
jgi:hypothetical protein